MIQEHANSRVFVEMMQHQPSGFMENGIKKRTVVLWFSFAI